MRCCVCRSCISWFAVCSAFCDAVQCVVRINVCITCQGEINGISTLFCSHQNSPCVPNPSASAMIYDHGTLCLRLTGEAKTCSFQEVHLLTNLCAWFRPILHNETGRPSRAFLMNNFVVTSAAVPLKYRTQLSTWHREPYKKAAKKKTGEKNVNKREGNKKGKGRFDQENYQRKGTVFYLYLPNTNPAPPPRNHWMFPKNWVEWEVPLKNIGGEDVMGEDFKQEPRHMVTEYRCFIFALSSCVCIQILLNI